MKQAREPCDVRLQIWPSHFVNTAEAQHCSHTTRSKRRPLEAAGATGNYSLAAKRPNKGGMHCNIAIWDAVRVECAHACLCEWALACIPPNPSVFNFQSGWVKNGKESNSLLPCAHQLPREAPQFNRGAFHGKDHDLCRSWMHLLQLCTNDCSLQWASMKSCHVGKPTRIRTCSCHWASICRCNSLRFSTFDAFPSVSLVSWAAVSSGVWRIDPCANLFVTHEEGSAPNKLSLERQYVITFLCLPQMHVTTRCTHTEGVTRTHLLRLVLSNCDVECIERAKALDYFWSGWKKSEIGSWTFPFEFQILQIIVKQNRSYHPHLQKKSPQSWVAPTLHHVKFNSTQKPGIKADCENRTESKLRDWGSWLSPLPPQWNLEDAAEEINWIL